ncbi:hypothetical protein C7Y47_16325 [Lysinibacillus sphaericus]|uniref:Uncharacterized protein n=1 Tax=Lysinibacillus sphaericus TaxID=1421 RepID=A0A544UCJ3_LYSSH|nr:DUF6886 family protein [Lysinibacillus sp. SDF0037]TQR30052.1 hypothetical protein C7Y47_16325 [Lysinibacillus sp. SDF0037]
MENTKLYLYEFDIREFSLQEQNAGYFTSETTQYPFAKFEIENLVEEMLNFFQRVSKHPLKEVKASGGCHGNRKGVQ